jgi:hypothetical protein
MGIFTTFVGASLALGWNDHSRQAAQEQAWQDERNAHRALAELIDDTVLSHSEVIARMTPAGMAFWDEELQRVRKHWEYLTCMLVGLVIGTVLIPVPGLGTIIGGFVGLLIGVTWRERNAARRVNAQFEREGWDVPRLMATLKDDHARRDLALTEARRRAMFGH